MSQAKVGGYEPALASRASPVARLDRLRPTSSHFLWILVLGTSYLVETFDNTVFGFLAPSIRQQWNMSIGDIGTITSAVFLGNMIGAVGAGRLSDRFGRKPLLIWSSIFYTAASVVCAFAPNLVVLAIGRVLTGAGVQASVGAMLVYMSEMYPRLSRGRFFAAIILFGYIGAPITSFTAAAIAPMAADAWRWVFGLGAIGIVVALAVGTLLPETVRWLTMNGREAEAEAIVSRLEIADRRRGELLPILPVSPLPRQGSLRELLTPQYAIRFTVVALTFAGALFCQYSFTAWVPTILVGNGMAQSQALYLSSVMTLGTFCIAPVLLLFADRIERKTALLMETILTGAAVTAFGFATDPTELTVAGFMVYVGLAGLVTTFYSYIPEVFPTDLRGVGTGLVFGVGRIAAFASGFAAAAMYTGMGAGRMYLIVGAEVIVAGIAVFLLGPRTTQRSLEAIADHD